MPKTITVSTFDAATATQLVSKGSKIYSLHLANLVASAQTIRVTLEQGDHLVYNLSLPVGTTVEVVDTPHGLYTDVSKLTVYTSSANGVSATLTYE